MAFLGCLRACPPALRLLRLLRLALALLAMLAVAQACGGCGADAPPAENTVAAEGCRRSASASGGDHHASYDAVCDTQRPAAGAAVPAGDRSQEAPDTSRESESGGSPNVATALRNAEKPGHEFSRQLEGEAAAAEAARAGQCLKQPECGKGHCGGVQPLEPEPTPLVPIAKCPRCTFTRCNFKYCFGKCRALGRVFICWRERNRVCGLLSLLPWRWDHACVPAVGAESEATWVDYNDGDDYSRGCDGDCGLPEESCDVEG